MTVKDISERIYAFDGNAEEWLAFEQEVNSEINKLSDEELEILVETEAMEHLLMICDGIRYESRGEVNGQF